MPQRSDTKSGNNFCDMGYKKVASQYNTKLRLCIEQPKIAVLVEFLERERLAGPPLLLVIRTQVYVAKLEKLCHSAFFEDENWAYQLFYGIQVLSGKTCYKNGCHRWTFYATNKPFFH